MSKPRSLWDDILAGELPPLMGHSGGVLNNPGAPMWGLRVGEVAAILSPARVMDGPGWYVCRIDSAAVVQSMPLPGYAEKADCVAEIERLKGEGLRFQLADNLVPLYWNGSAWVEEART